MWMRWIYRSLALFVGRKAWQAFQRRRARSQAATDRVAGGESFR